MSKRFDYMDLEIQRGIAFQESIPIVGEDGQPIPEEDIVGGEAVIVLTNDVDGEVEVAFEITVQSTDFVNVRISLDQTQTLALVAPHLNKNFGWWFMWYIKNGDKVPVKRGRVFVR